MKLYLSIRRDNAAGNMPHLYSKMTSIGSSRPICGHPQYCWGGLRNKSALGATQSARKNRSAGLIILAASAKGTTGDVLIAGKIVKVYNAS
jgi:hypothetical protein